MGIICWPAHLISISHCGAVGRGSTSQYPEPLVNCRCCCWGPPVTNFDYETWQLFLIFFFSFFYFFVFFLSSSKLAAFRRRRNGTTPKALLIFVPHKTQPPDGQAVHPPWLSPGCTHSSFCLGVSDPGGYEGWLISFRIFIAGERESCPTGV